MLDLPPFILRLYQPSDFDAVLAVMQSAAQADHLPMGYTAEQLRARLRAPHHEPRLNAADDMWVIATRRSGVTAYADGWLTGDGAQRRYRSECFVQPAERGHGLGHALLTRQCQRAQAIARKLAAPGAPVTVTLGARAWQQQPTAVALLEAKGLQRVRTYLELSRDLAQPLAGGAAPAGLRLEPWLDRRADEALWQCYNEAFAEHWGFAPETFDVFMRRMSVGNIHGQHCVLAWAGGTLAGASLNDMEATPGERPAWIRQLFVRRAWRSRGLGRALVEASLSHAKQLGYSKVGLMVDEENSTGAPQLYRNAGFEEAARRFAYEISFSAADNTIERD